MIDRNSAAYVARMDQMFARVSEAVTERGHMIVSVHPKLAYTVGLTKLNKPELVLTNSGGLLTMLLDEIAGWYAKDLGTIAPPEMEWYAAETDSVHTYAVAEHDPADEKDPLGIARGLYGSRVRALCVDLLSCPCKFCEHKVTVDDAGNIMGFVDPQ